VNWRIQWTYYLDKLVLFILLFSFNSSWRSVILQSTRLLVTWFSGFTNIWVEMTCDVTMVTFIRPNQQNLLIPPLLIALTFQKRLEYRNFCQVTPQITGLICVPRYLHLANYKSAFVVLPFGNAMEHWNADGRINSSNDQATPDINLAGFRSVYQEFMRINCEQRASISSWASLSAFARWQHNYVLLLPARGRNQGC